MKKGKGNNAEAVRRLAEERLRAKGAEKEQPVWDPDEQKLLHELQVHQIELEMQNEELRRAQHEREESEDKFLDFYDFAPVGYLTLDESGMMTELNLAAAGFLGIERSRLAHRPFSQFIQPEFQDTFSLHKEEVLSSSTRRTCDLELRKADGSSLHVQLDSIRVEINGERAMHTVLTDVTYLKQAEAQLRQAQKMEAIGTLAGGIAHDFNNILAAIVGFTELVMDDVEGCSPLVGKNLENVLKAAMRAKELVKQILAFSRKTPRARNPMSLSPLVKETIRFLRASIPATVEIRLTLGASSDTILADPGEVQQVLMNLATNASLAMQDKEGTLEISLTDIDFIPGSPFFAPDLMPGEYVQLTVKDTGMGMSPETMKRLFEPFFTTREVGEGTGMGLAVVYGIVKDLRGAVAVESTLGAGSTFRVLLPKAKADFEKEHLSKVEAPQGTERILFVDDEQMIVEWGQAVLERVGYTVTALTDPAEALRAFTDDPTRFDLVITDQTMRSMTGVQLAGELLKIRPDIPIILCTGHSETVSPDIAKEAGIREYLMKPLVKQELAAAVRRALDTHREE